MRRLLNLVVSLVVLFGLVFGTVTLVRLANGDYAGDYTLSGTFPSAGEGLHPGSAVVFRGVQVGRVSTISLDQNQAQVTVLIEPSFKVPAASTATIEPVNLFGAEQVSITSPHGNAERRAVPVAGGILRPRCEQRRAGRSLCRCHSVVEQDRHQQPLDGAGGAGAGIAG